MDNRGLSRRDFLRTGAAALAGAAALGLAGCGGASDDPNALTFTTYELPDNAVLEALIRRYERQNPDISIELQRVPGGNYWPQLETRLAAGEGPDIVRINYQRLKKYSSGGALVDVTDPFDERYGEQFVPAVWQAVRDDGRTWGLPHHTDTFATFYNIAFFDQLGIDVPQSLDESWSWEEFIEIARRLKSETDAEYAFAFNWQGETPYRWLPFLYMNGGRLLAEDLRTPEITAPEGVEALEWTQGWFTEGLVPPNTTVKVTEEIQNLFANRTIGMMLNGDWLLPAVEDLMGKDGWGVTYMPRGDSGMASDLGGNGFCVTKDCANPEAAIDFLRFLGTEENMRYFVTEANFLPTRKSLVEERLAYKSYAPEMNLFKEQSTTVPSSMARAETIPAFEEINQRMSDEFDLMLTSGQSPQETAENVATAIEDAVRED